MCKLSSSLSELLDFQKSHRYSSSDWWDLHVVVPLNGLECISLITLILISIWHHTVIVHHWSWIFLVVCHVGVCCSGKFLSYGLKRSLLLLHFSCHVNVVPPCCVLHLCIVIQLICCSLTLYKWNSNKLYQQSVFKCVSKENKKNESKKKNYKFWCVCSVSLWPPNELHKPEKSF